MIEARQSSNRLIRKYGENNPDKHLYVINNKSPDAFVKEGIDAKKVLRGTVNPTPQNWHDISHIKAFHDDAGNLVVLDARTARDFTNFYNHANEYLVHFDPIAAEFAPLVANKDGFPVTSGSLGGSHKYEFTAPDRNHELAVRPEDWPDHFLLKLSKFGSKNKSTLTMNDYFKAFSHKTTKSIAGIPFERLQNMTRGEVKNHFDENGMGDLEPHLHEWEEHPKKRLEKSAESEPHPNAYNILRRPAMADHIDQKNLKIEEVLKPEKAKPRGVKGVLGIEEEMILDKDFNKKLQNLIEEIKKDLKDAL